MRPKGYGDYAYRVDWCDNHTSITAFGTNINVGSMNEIISVTNTQNGETTRYLWCDEVSICQTRSGFDVPQTSYYGQGEITGNARRYYHRDHLGSVVDVLNPSGVRLAQMNYTSYGALKSSQANTGVTLPNHRYAGMWWDDKANLYLTHYRAYSPTVGRWLSRDPMGEAVNLYSYVSNRSLNFASDDGDSAQLVSRYLANFSAKSASLGVMLEWWKSPKWRTPKRDWPPYEHCNCKKGVTKCNCIFQIDELYCMFAKEMLEFTYCLVAAKEQLTACYAEEGAY